MTVVGFLISTAASAEMGVASVGLTAARTVFDRVRHTDPVTEQTA